MAPEKSGEFRGKTVDAAISNGLAVLGLSRDRVEVEVVRPGSRGLLGIGAEDAIVRLTAIASARPEAQVKAEPKPEVQPARPEPAVAPRPEAQPAPGSEPRPAPKPARVPMQRSEPIVEPAGTTAPVEPSAKTTDSVEQGREILEHLLEYMNLRAQVEVVPQSEIEAAGGERGVVLNIVGDDLGVLIGRQSEVMSALQFLTRLMVNQSSRGRANLVVDVNGYKAKRTESLRKLALRTADQVMQTGRTMSLEPMPPAERRIIHLTLRNHPDVTSQSVGEGSRRKVTVVPKKA